MENVRQGLAYLQSSTWRFSFTNPSTTTKSPEKNKSSDQSTQRKASLGGLFNPTSRRIAAATAAKSNETPARNAAISPVSAHMLFTALRR